MPAWKAPGWCRSLLTWRRWTSASFPGESPTSSMRRPASGREAQEQDWQQVFATNAQASGRLVAACAGAAFVYCSTGSAYAYQGPAAVARGRPAWGPPRGVQPVQDRGGGRRALRRGAIGQPPHHHPHLLDVRAGGGTPVNRLRRILRGEEIVLYPDAPNNYNPIYEDDYVRLAVRALEVAVARPGRRQLRRQRDGQRRGILRLPGRAGRPPGRSATTPAPPGRSGPT